jgi:hypothetical protein
MKSADTKQKAHILTVGQKRSLLRCLRSEDKRTGRVDLRLGFA